MTEDTKTAVIVSRILKNLSEKIEKNPGMIKDLGLDLSDPASCEKGYEPVNGGEELDAFSVFAEKGESALRRRLSGLDLQTLKDILHRHNFDPSHFAKRWRDKDRVIDLIVKRVSAGSKIGGKKR